ncbi:MAG TPA: hypothetical protein DCM08_01665 [Microscillaceae bacterium]|nr:hypothetical protein [Microscillaceae bacterium]
MLLVAVWVGHTFYLSFQITAQTWEKGKSSQAQFAGFSTKKISSKQRQVMNLTYQDTQGNTYTTQTLVGDKKPDTTKPFNIRYNPLNPKVVVFGAPNWNDYYITLGYIALAALVVILAPWGLVLMFTQVKNTQNRLNP